MIRILGCAGLVSILALSAMADDGRLTGTATYRERMALPPGAIFEVVLQDVSRADAPAADLGAYRRVDPGSPPFRFEIPYDPARIRPEGTYAVQAMVWVDGSLRFITDTVEPVLTRGGGTDVDLLMVGVGRDGAAAGPLRPRARVASSPATGQLRGYVTYADGGPQFTDCASGRQMRLSEGGDYPALEHAFLAAGAEPGGRLMASFVGRVPEDGGDAGEVTVERFLGVWPEEGCDRAATGGKSLEKSSWQILQIGGLDLSGADTARLPVIRFLSEDRLRYAAGVGCNQLIGLVEINGSAVKFGPAASTMMACTPPLDTWERALGGALERAVSWRGGSETLELLDATGTIVMRLARAPRS